MRKKIIALVCALVLCLGLIPVANASNDVIFVALNDNLSPLSADTMPFWSDGMIYVPYTTFDGRTADIDLGLYATYSERDKVVTVYNMQQMLVFDLSANNFYNYHTGATYNISAITRNGVTFIPAYIICDVFGLEYSYQQTAYGPLLRIKGEYWLNDALFIDAASWTMTTYLREYNQSIATTTTTPEVTAPEVEEVVSHAPTYLSILCDLDAPISEILWSLTAQNVKALFLLTPEQIAQDGDGVRQILGSGHTIGIWAEGDTAQETEALLQAGLDGLAAAAYTTTTIAQVPADHQEALQGDGWLFWEADQTLTPEIEEDVSRYATAIIRALTQNGQSLSLSILANQTMSDCFTDILIQLDSRSFDLLSVTEFVV